MGLHAWLCRFADPAARPSPPADAPAPPSADKHKPRPAGPAAAGPRHASPAAAKVDSVVGARAACSAATFVAAGELLPDKEGAPCVLQCGH